MPCKSIAGPPPCVYPSGWTPGNATSFDLYSLGLTSDWTQRVEEATAAVMVAPTQTKPYLDLVETLGAAQHSARASSHGHVRRLHYLAALLDGLAVLKASDPDEQVLSWDGNISSASGGRLTTMYNDTILELQEKVFGQSTELTNRMDHASAIPPAKSSNPNLEEVHVAIIAVGNYGAYSRATLTSLLWHASRTIHLHVLSDSEGWEGVLLAASSLPAPLRQRLSLTQVSFLENLRFRAVVDALPTECHGGLGHAHHVHVFLHEVLPDSIHRVAFADIGDVLFAADIAELWDEFNRFRGREICAIAVEGGLAYKERYRYGIQDNNNQNPRLLRLRAANGFKYLWSKFLNPAGVSLWDLQKARALNWTATVHKIMKPLGPQGCELACMDVATQVIRRRPDLWYDLSSTWHYYPETPWERSSEELESAYGFFWPEELRGRRMPFGLLNGMPLELENPCPPTPLIFMSTVLQRRKDLTSKQVLAWLRQAHLIDEEGYAPRYYGKAFSSDVGCGSAIKMLHATGVNKFELWAQQLFALWGQAPPKKWPSEDVMTVKYNASLNAAHQLG